MKKYKAIIQINETKEVKEIIFESHNMFTALNAASNILSRELTNNVTYHFLSLTLIKG